MNLETRARAAVASARESAAALPLPGAPFGSRRPRQLTVGLAGLTVILLVVGLLAIGGNDRGTQVVAGGGPTRLAPTSLREGLKLDGVEEDLSAVDDRLPRASLHLYGRPGDDNPFAAADLAVIVVDAQQLTGDEVIAIRGVEGQIIEEALPGGRGINWIEGERSAALLSRSLGVDDLVKLAESMTVSLEDPGLTADELPDDLELVMTRDDLGTSFAAPYLPAVDGYSLSYSSSGGGAEDRRLTVTVIAGSEPELDLVRWWFGPDAQPARVRGHDGVVTTTERVETVTEVAAPDFGADPTPAAEPENPKVRIERTRTTTLAWVEADGVVVTLVGENLDQGELLRVADSLEPLSADDWALLLAQVPDPGPPIAMAGPTRGDVLAAGETDGVTWRVRSSEPWDTDPEPRYCLEIGPEGAPTSGACGVDLPFSTEGGSPSVLSFGHALNPDQPAVFGRAMATVARVLVETDGSGPAEAEIFDGPDDVRFYVAVLPAGAMPGEVVALDAAGQEIGRQPVDAEALSLSGGPPPIRPLP